MTIIRPKSLRDLALERLRDQIIDGTLKMGQMLSERGISDELGVSKSPVREALAQLREEGLVLIEPQKGARVFSLTAEAVEQLCDFRMAIEGAAFDLALERASEALANDMDMNVKDMAAAQKAGDISRYLALDTEFHQMIFKHCGNDYLTASYARFAGKIAALRTHLSKMPGHTSMSFDEHQEMARAVRAGEGARIKELLKEHIGRTRQTYAQSLHLLQDSNA
jgi:DNA-binding GntR family transcriptional regulator